AEDGIRGFHVTGVQTCALPISAGQQHLRATWARDQRNKNGCLSGAATVAKEIWIEVVIPSQPSRLMDWKGGSRACLKSGCQKVWGYALLSEKNVPLLHTPICSSFPSPFGTASSTRW